MVLDLLIGIAASLIASVIVGFLGNKAVSKQNSIILKIYVLFLSMATFIVAVLATIILNRDFMSRLIQVSEANMLTFYSRSINSFVFIIGIVAFMTCIVIGIEAYDRGARRYHKESMDRIKTLK